MKLSRGKLPVSVAVVIVCAIALAIVFFTEDLRALTTASIPKLKACSENDGLACTGKKETVLLDVDVDEDKEDFDPNECSVTKGKWVFNSSVEPLYTDQTCPYLDRQVSCQSNGRPDSDYLYWEWQLDECNLPRFNAADVLEKLRGKRLMFVGDSLQMGQWMSFVCMVQSQIPAEHKSMTRGRVLSVFNASVYNATIEFYWAPFLIESNSDLDIISDPKKRILRVDSIYKHAQKWVGVDILVFNTYIWWMSTKTIKSLWGSFANGDEGVEELDTVVSYHIGLKTWANWVDSTVNSSTTRVFFSTMSPSHSRNQNLPNDKSVLCYNKTEPVKMSGFWRSESNQKIMGVLSGIASRMKVPMTFLNITQLSDHRIDAHTAVFTASEGKVLTDEQKADPHRYADCIHWCLPGVPDTWNRLLYAYL